MSHHHSMRELEKSAGLGNWMPLFGLLYAFVREVPKSSPLEALLQCRAAAELTTKFAPESSSFSSPAGRCAPVVESGSQVMLIGEIVNLRRISPFGCITALSSFWMHYRIIFLLDAFILRFARSFLDLNFQDRLSQHHAMRFKFPSYRIGKFYVSLSLCI